MKGRNMPQNHLTKIREGPPPTRSPAHAAGEI
jgi:hypothetical protein